MPHPAVVSRAVVEGGATERFAARLQSPEMTLDFIEALLWPAVVLVGVFWLFRSEGRTLLGKAGDPVGADRRPRWSRRPWTAGSQISYRPALRDRPSRVP